MITRVAQVITWASACRCFEASERTSASASLAFASIRRVIFLPSQVASRVSRIVPITSSTISRPLPRAHVETSVSGRTVRNIALHHCRAAFGDYPSATADYGRHAEGSSSKPQCQATSAGKGARQRESVSVRTDRGRQMPATAEPLTRWPGSQEYSEYGTIALVVPACTRDCDSGCSGPRRHLTIQVGQVACHDRSYRLAGPGRLDASGARRTR